MVLVRSDSGQLLMSRQHTLAQMAIAPQHSTASSVPPIQVPGATVIIWQVTPAANIMQGSLQTAIQGTATPKRPLVPQSPVVSGTDAAPPVQTLFPWQQTSVIPRTVRGVPRTLVNMTARTLPALHHMTTETLAIKHSQLLQPGGQPTTAMLTAVRMPSSSQFTPGKASGAVTTAFPQSVSRRAGQSGLLVQAVMIRPSYVTLGQTPMTIICQPLNHVTFSASQTIEQLQTAPMVKQRALPGSKAPSGNKVLALAAKNRLKEGDSFRCDYENVNDVAFFAGESAHVLATSSHLVGTVTRSYKDEAFLSSSLLHRRVLHIGKKYGITEIGPDVIDFISHAARQRLQNLLEKLSEIAQHKNMSFKEDGQYEQTSDVHSQLKFFKQIDQIENHKREEVEREILIAAKLQQQELLQLRQHNANLTTLTAIEPRKEQKFCRNSPGSTAGPDHPVSSLEDLLFCLESERRAVSSQLLFRSFLK